MMTLEKILGYMVEVSAAFVLLAIIVAVFPFAFIYKVGRAVHDSWTDPEQYAENRRGWF